ncbi:hypothetical protein [uncultured Oscillibacter sp.]|uniref:hypothetical protein n=1 Tax=uncultured Oscillibacter sp. TaxID=876091 RepID=UPI0021748010|nr:hypothetical protein [uncultured Oscillibacter sp.]MCI9011872.1 hypothetical protein [Oscillibacter sp.]
MAEEMTEPVQAVPEEEAPKQEDPKPEAPPQAAPVPAEKPKKKDGPALTVLTVLLVLVGVADLALWGLAGFYFLGNL